MTLKIMLSMLADTTVCYCGLFFLAVLLCICIPIFESVPVLQKIVSSIWNTTLRNTLSSGITGLYAKILISLNSVAKMFAHFLSFLTCLFSLVWKWRGETTLLKAKNQHTIGKGEKNFRCLRVTGTCTSLHMFGPFLQNPETTVIL